MKFSKFRQLIPVLFIGLFVATLLTACAITTIDYVLVATNSGIEVFAVDSQSGALRTGAPTVSSGVSTPVAMAVTSDYTSLYVANLGTSSSSGNVVHYAIGLNGELTVKDTLNLTGNPVSLAVNSAGSYLYVTSCTASATVPSVVCANTGTLAEYPLSSGTIGALTASSPLSLSGAYATDVLVPTGVNVLANNTIVQGNAVYVSAYDEMAYNPGGATPSSANPGWVFGFTVGSGGALTPTASSPYEAGIKPSAIISDPTNRFVYVTDFASNELIGYTILNGSTLYFMTAGPFRTGNEPSAVAIDPRGDFIYVGNSLDSTVSAYSIVQATGNPSGVVNVTGSATNSTDTQPVSIAVDPALGRFVYTANKLGESVSGFRLNSTSGALSTTQSTPYPTTGTPSALVVIPHGNHATQAVAP